MRLHTTLGRCLMVACMGLFSALASFNASAADVVVGVVKKLEGTVTIEREGKTLPAVAGMPVNLGDRIKTGPNGAVGLTLKDDTLLSTGPSTELVVSAFQFDTTTHEGNLVARLVKGSLHVVTGLIGKHSPQKMQIQTPTVVLGVRGTEFIVQTAVPA